MAVNQIVCGNKQPAFLSVEKFTTASDLLYLCYYQYEIAGIYMHAIRVIKLSSQNPF
ncbi:hypothetical protein SAMN05216262_10722 [Colwellia chukchiensis]|uniref:Uncharacterized protein n=1 Tax=Colwellia chukchiensis TaxID=641665 RepID=A0A1H7N3R3_9GAMM|nr:hypothetical protein SAMN05216262_10722 [Colwellia chukchiensis]